MRATIIVCALLSLAYITLYERGKKDMAVIYATLIVKGYKTYAQVPARLKTQVKEILINLELPELVEE